MDKEIVISKKKWGILTLKEEIDFCGDIICSPLALFP